MTEHEWAPHPVDAYLTSDNGTGEHDSWIPINLADLPETPPTPPQLGGFGLVYHGKRHVFSGPQESAKTLAAYAIGLETLRAHPDRLIAVIDFEMGQRSARTRLRELGATNPELGRILYVHPEQPATPNRISVLIDFQPVIVIIDAAAGAYSLQGFSDNDRGDVERFANLYIDAFFRHGIATIVLDHVVKNSEARGKYAIGSERKTGGVDVHLGFDTIRPVKRGGTGVYKISTHKDRDGWHQRGQLAELQLASHPDTHRITWEWKQAEHTEPGETWMPTIVMQHISELLEQSTVPLTRNQLVDLAGVKRDTALKAIGHLVRLGYAIQAEGAGASQPVQHHHSFTVLEWESKDNSSPVPGGSQLVPGTTNHPVVPLPLKGQGSGTTGTPENHQVVPNQTTWLDDLEPWFPEDPPADLHDRSNDPY